jgi:hypothetical protein
MVAHSLHIETHKAGLLRMRDLQSKNASLRVLEGLDGTVLCRRWGRSKRIWVFIIVGNQCAKYLIERQGKLCPGHSLPFAAGLQSRETFGQPVVAPRIALLLPKLGFRGAYIYSSQPLWLQVLKVWLREFACAGGIFLYSDPRPHHGEGTADEKLGREAPPMSTSSDPLFV